MSDAGAPRVKICGLTLEDDAAHAAALGVDYLGLNFWPSSKRYLAPQRAPALAAAARGAGPAALVGVFVNATLDEIEGVHARVALDVIQLHGDEPPALLAELARRLGLPVWRALPVDAAAPDAATRWRAAAALLLDAPSAGRGGSGRTVDAELARAVQRAAGAQHVVLAGGLRPDNVAEAVRRFAPWAVDTASGVERAPGEKDPAKVRAFLHAARTAARGDVLPDEHG